MKIEMHKYAPKRFAVVLSDGYDASITSVRRVMADDEEAAVLAAKKEWYADQTRDLDVEDLKKYPFYPGDYNVIAVIETVTAHFDRDADNNEQRGANMKNTLHAMADRSNAPTVITAPGDYITRNGSRVTIYHVDNGSAPYTFPCKGSAWKIFRGAMRPRKYNAWMRSGHLNVVGDHPLDIVGPWEGE